MIWEGKLDADHLDVANTLRALGECAYMAGRTKEAEELYRRALTIRKRIWTPITRRGIYLVTARDVRLQYSEDGRGLGVVQTSARYAGELGLAHPDMIWTLHALGSSCAYTADERVDQAVCIDEYLNARVRSWASVAPMWWQHVEL